MAKVKFYKVSFTWGKDYNDTLDGIRHIDLNVHNASNKFDALAKAFALVSPIVAGEEPSKMDCRSSEGCE